MALERKASISNLTGTHLSRRHMMAAMLGVGAATAVGMTAQTERATGLVPPPPGWSPVGESQSTNGWPLIARPDDPRIEFGQIEGSPASVTLLTGDVRDVLIYVARRFNYEVERFQSDPLHPDFVLEETRGWESPRATEAPHESNYFSGTAIGCKPGFFPLHGSGELFPNQRLVIQDIVAQCEGVVAWGGYFGLNHHESHFEIAAPPSDPALRTLAARFRDERERRLGPGFGAELAFEPDRIERGRIEAARQLKKYALT